MSATTTKPLREAMQKVRLYTRQGVYVCTVDVPNFDPPIEVISWGSRYFVLNGNKSGGTMKYVEGMHFAAIGTVEYEKEVEEGSK